MDYSDEIKIWNMAMIEVLDIKCELLSGSTAHFLYESNAIIFVSAVDGMVAFNGNTYILRASSILHISANTKVSMESFNGNFKYYAILYRASISPNAGRRIVLDASANDIFRRDYIVEITDSFYISNHFISILNEWKNKAPLSELKIKHHFYAILYSVYKERSEQKIRNIEWDAIDYACMFFKQNFSKPILIKELSDSLGRTRSTFHKQFRDKTGLSPQQYLMKIRLESAVEMLENSTIPLDDIAASCGLGDKSYFSRIFKQNFKISPGAYRKENAYFKRSKTLCLSSSANIPEDEKCIVVESMGRVHRYYHTPQRVVCFDYATAEMCAALGISSLLVGVSSAEDSLEDCTVEFQHLIRKVPFLKGKCSKMTVPDFQAVCECKPDIVIGTGYSFNQYGGVADAEEFERKGIHIFATRATYTLGCDYNSVYEDIKNLGKIFKKNETAEKLIETMKAEENALAKTTENRDSHTRVFSFDDYVSDKAITCGKSIENHIISSAGGVNIFGDREGQFIVVDWKEVSEANPEVILVHSFNNERDGLNKVDKLKKIPEIAQTDAVLNNRIYIIGIKKIFPAIDNLKTALWLSNVLTGRCIKSDSSGRKV